MGVVSDITGQRFGRLVAIEQCGRSRHGAVEWLCRCECGSEIRVVGYSLRNGDTKSCGCLRTGPSRQRPHNASHGMAGTAIYLVWRGMIDRCNNQKSKSYASYGGRGISVCQEWMASFERFLSDMGERPVGASIERINNDGNYCPDNCRWASRSEQATNKRNNVHIEVDGERLTISQWAERIGCSPSAITSRIKSGMSLRDAVTTPIPERPNAKLTQDDAICIRRSYPSKPCTQLAREFGVSKKTILNVIHRKTFVDDE